MFWGAWCDNILSFSSDNERDEYKVKNFLTKAQKVVKERKLLFIIGLACMALVIAFFVLRARLGGPRPDPITLTYANWNLGVNWNDPLELRMLQSFMDEHPHITVEIDTSIASPWMDSISAAAYENRLPDVFIVDDLGTKADNGWLLDLTTQAWADTDFFDLPNLIQGGAMVGGRVYALPFTQDIQGYFVNRDLFRELGQEPPSFGISAPDFIAAARNATDLSHPSIGINHSFSFVDWYPGAVNPLLGFFAFNGISFALNSPEMLGAVRLAAEVHNNGYTFNSIPQNMVAGYFPIGYDLGAFRYGQMAMYYGGTSWLMNIMANEVPFEWDFIGVPGGRSVVTLEIIGISSHTDYPEEAYMLASWMGHGTEGNLRRLQYAQEMGITITYMPASQNRQVLDALFQMIPAPGLASAYGAMDMVLLDGMRVLPGYMQARHSAPTGVAIPGHHTNAGVEHLIIHSILGDMYFPSHSAVAEEVARQALEAAQGR